MAYQVVGKLRDVLELRKLGSSVAGAGTLTLDDIDDILNGRSFTRWYKRNKKVVNTLALAAPAVAFTIFGVSPAMLSALLFKSSAVAIPVAAQGAQYSFWAGHGKILLDMLIVGFVTLVVTTFLKFTGRGDLAPLVVFVGGGIILYEVIGLFSAIYKAVATFFQL